MEAESAQMMTTGREEIYRWDPWVEGSTQQQGANPARWAVPPQEATPGMEPQIAGEQQPPSKMKVTGDTTRFDFGVNSGKTFLDVYTTSPEFVTSSINTGRCQAEWLKYLETRTGNLIIHTTDKKDDKDKVIDNLARDLAETKAELARASERIDRLERMMLSISSVTALART